MSRGKPLEPPGLELARDLGGLDAHWRELAEVAYAEEWLTVERAVDYTTLSAKTLERLEDDGALRRGGTPHKRLYKRKWLDAALGANPLIRALVALLALVVLLLAAELVDVVTPWGGKWFPPKIGHPLLHHHSDAFKLRRAS